MDWRTKAVRNAFSSASCWDQLTSGYKTTFPTKCFTLVKNVECGSGQALVTPSGEWLSRLVRIREPICRGLAQKLHEGAFRKCETRRWQTDALPRRGEFGFELETGSRVDRCPDQSRHVSDLEADAHFE
ncbi:hypothetical protein QLX08_010751 [Tetragonisca angustula]|uniref:Uncharacterized protein n=1 Tax=Tetragonisca angustula TaxID=166442 RepID=A0AAW0ZBF8_9HYME